MLQMLNLPDWLPWWVPLALLVPASLWALSFLFMPFSVFGVKSRLEVIEARLEEIQSDLRHMAVQVSSRRRTRPGLRRSLSAQTAGAARRPGLEPAADSARAARTLQLAQRGATRRPVRRAPVERQPTERQRSERRTSGRADAGRSAAAVAQCPPGAPQRSGRPPGTGRTQIGLAALGPTRHERRWRKRCDHPADADDNAADRFGGCLDEAVAGIAWRHAVPAGPWVRRHPGQSGARRSDACMGGPSSRHLRGCRAAGNGRCVPQLQPCRRPGR